MSFDKPSFSLHTQGMDDPNNFKLVPHPDQKHHRRILLYLIGILLIIISTLCAGYLLGIKQKQSISQVVTSTDTHVQQKDNIANFMQDMGCNSQVSCMIACAKPENINKCKMMMEYMNKDTSNFYVSTNFLSSFNPTEVPAITANPIDVQRIFAISLFRSGIGHDYSANSWDGETCRSMKHYFNFAQYQVNGSPSRSTPGAGESNINIFAPFDGTIIANNPEQTPIGTQVLVASSKNPAFYVKLFHIDLLPTLKVGSSVSSGQMVGTIGPRDGMDVSYEARLQGFKTVYLSIFDYMTSQAFSPYIALGFKPSDFILSQTQADVKGYKCNGERFVANTYYQGKKAIDGFVFLRANPYSN